MSDQLLDLQLVMRFGSDHPKGDSKCRLCGETYNEFHAYRPTEDQHFNFVCLNDDYWFYISRLNEFIKSYPHDMGCRAP